MNSSVLSIFTVTCCLLVNEQWATASALPKPVLRLFTQHPQNTIVKGDTITLKCMGGLKEADEFHWLHTDESGVNETKKSSGSEFQLMDVQSAQDGLYTCNYCVQGDCSEFSSSWNIFVHNTFPKPQIIVSPRRVVQPGATVTVTCNAYYSDVEFSMLKNNVIVKNGGGNMFSYVINNANQNNVGLFSCEYQSKARGIKSSRSNTMKIAVLELPAPLLTLEENPRDTTMLTINCTATDNKYNEFFFVLLDGSEEINKTEEIQGSVEFSITKPKYTMKTYQCLYRVKIGDDYADSLYSSLQIGSNGFQMLLFIRHIISAVILILLGIIVLMHFNYIHKKERRPDLPPPRVSYRKGKEDTEVKW